MQNIKSGRLVALLLVAAFAVGTAVSLTTPVEKLDCGQMVKGALNPAPAVSGPAKAITVPEMPPTPPLAPATPSLQVMTTLERGILDRAMRCNHGKHSADEKFLLAVLRLEDKYGVPQALRGMTLAAACHESGFNPKAEGDHRFSKTGKPMAIGLMQQWPWWVSAYKLNRKDPMAAADTWLRHIVKQIPSVQKRCGPQTQERLWVNAWVQAIRAPRKGGRCGQVPHHYIDLVKWREAWKNLQRVASAGGAPHGT